MKKYIALLITAGSLCIAQAVWSPILAAIPDKPVPSRFVCDYAGILDATRAELLNDRLQLVSDSTTNQVVVVTIADLEGLDPADYALQLGRKWGVGTKERNNGVVILLKPRNDNGAGKVEIATGYGAEGALTDVMCGHIIDTQMLPYLREGDYTTAAEEGAYACAERLCLEYADGWMPEGWLSSEEDLTEDDIIGLFAAFIIMIVVIIIASRMSGKKSSNVLFFPPGRSGGNRSGGFSSGPSHSSFGGGSFGGGGAGRSF